MRNTIGQCPLSIHQFDISETVPVKSSEAIFSFVEESKELYSRFRATYLLVLDTKNHHVRSFWFYLLGYGTIYAARGMDFQVEGGAESKTNKGSI